MFCHINCQSLLFPSFISRYELIIRSKQLSCLFRVFFKTFILSKENIKTKQEIKFPALNCDHTVALSWLYGYLTSCQPRDQNHGPKIIHQPDSGDNWNRQFPKSKIKSFNTPVANVSLTKAISGIATTQGVDFFVQLPCYNRECECYTHALLVYFVELFCSTSTSPTIKNTSYIYLKYNNFNYNIGSYNTIFLKSLWMSTECFFNLF